MDAKELRIGNIVNFGIVLEPIIIKGITEQSSTIEMAEPIPLTEDWILKLGFSKNEEQHYFSNGLIWINWWSWDSVDLVFDGQPINLKHIKHVHTLQNLYFALTGEELTLKQ